MKINFIHAHLCCLVLRCGDEICAVGRKLNVVDLRVEFVCLNVRQLLTSLVAMSVSRCSNF